MKIYLIFFFCSFCWKLLEVPNLASLSIISSTQPYFAATCRISLPLYIFYRLFTFRVLYHIFFPLPEFLFRFICIWYLSPFSLITFSILLYFYFPVAYYFSCFLITLSYICSFYLSLVFRSLRFAEKVLRSTYYVSLLCHT